MFIYEGMENAKLNTLEEQLVLEYEWVLQDLKANGMTDYIRGQIFAYESLLGNLSLHTGQKYIKRKESIFYGIH